ncbi:ubiquinol-cytochrome C chaperone family protein [Fodinicurvata sediminis]|uniref:ubiquinol-cytochrome C chaperone family protein n=1 Tax=Fodinicurvata sediminis TaxID=1121832 RepID=UPI0003B495A0|nr:ubiquinol-cytochrome C chaperone family protein [Fodinicurvata sediminis]
MFRRLFSGDPRESAARALYESIMLQSRQPEFYTDYAVPDSTEGRFELLLIHLGLVIRRLKCEENEEARELSQNLFDFFVYDMDQSLRESGIGDLSVGPRLRRVGEAFYGRVKAYEAALDAGNESQELGAALLRNLYATRESEPGQETVMAMAEYLYRVDAFFAEQETPNILSGQIKFSELDAARDKD